MQSKTRFQTKLRLTAALLVCLVCAACVSETEAASDASLSDASAPAALAVWQERCASCHDHPTPRIPPRSALRYAPPLSIVQALETGSMRPMAEGLTPQEIRGLVPFLTGRTADASPDPEPPACDDAPRFGGVAAGDWAQTGRDASNDRFQSVGADFGERVGDLDLEWALAIPGGAPGPPVVVGEVVFQTAGTGAILALDAGTGCLHWSYAHDAPVRSVSVGEVETGAGMRELRVFFGDHQGFVTALAARDGRLRWKLGIEDHVLAKVTAAPTLAGGRVFVGMSSIEDPLTHDPTHACCTFRGSVTALDGASGRILWKRHTVEPASSEIAPQTAEAPARFAPAGGAVYTPVAVDVASGRVFASTGEAYTAGAPRGAYSVIAFDFEDGSRLWERQFLPAPEERRAVCEEVGYTDCRNLFSMGTSVTIHPTRAGGAGLLLVGQKWGYVYGLDPEQGAVRWKRRVSDGGDMGGVMYGLADDGQRVYAAISDLYDEAPRLPGGLVALEPSKGKELWRAEPKSPQCGWGEPGCTSAQSAAPTAVPGVVFAPSWDGHVRAHASTDGALLWDFDTGVSFDAVNGVKASGGQIAGWPVVVAGGRVFVTSGASSMARPGNALLVFSPRSRTGPPD